LTEKTCIFFN